MNVNIPTSLFGIIFGGAVVGALVYLGQSVGVREEKTGDAADMLDQPLDPYDVTPNPATASINGDMRETEASPGTNIVDFQAKAIMDIQYNEKMGYDRIRNNTVEPVYTNWATAYDPVERD